MPIQEVSLFLMRYYFKFSMDFRKSFQWLSGLVLTVVLYSPLQAQYYYQDIYNTLQTNQEQQVFRNAQVLSLKLTSLEPTQQVNKDFKCHQDFTDSYRQALMETSSFETGTSRLHTRFNAKLQLVASADSSAAGINTTTYAYDTSGRIVKVAFSFSSHAGGSMYDETETHVYRYDSLGILRKMKRFKNGSLYSVISFSPDSSGRPMDEVEVPLNGRTSRIAYHYTNDGLLSDIYKYNTMQKKWMPAYLFDYNQAGQLTEMTTVLLNENSYLLWKYSYNQKGLKDETSCFGKNSQPQGTIKYSYTYK